MSNTTTTTPGSTGLINTAQAERYTKSWGPFDIFCLFVDALAVFETNQVLRSADSSSLRGLRCFRFLRLVRENRIQAEIFQGFDKNTRTVIEIIRFFLYILLSFHLFACAWFFVGMHSGEPSWVYSVGAENEGSVEQYYISLHWALSQFTPAPNKLMPQNSTERVFVCYVIYL